MRKLVVIIAVIGLVVSYLPAIAGEGVGEGGSYVPKQEGIQENEPTVEKIVQNAFIQQGQSSWMQCGQQGVDAAAAINGTWQVEYQIQTVMGTVPQAATETWRWDAINGVYYDGSGWMWRGKTAGNYLQVKTRLVTGARAMLTMQFLSYHEAVGRINVSGTAKLSPCYGQFRATRIQ